MVLADGTFDPLHYGHVRYLVHASTFGPLVVRVAPDADVLAKGRALFQSQADRARTVLALRMVTAVCRDETLVEAITRLTPRYLIKGEDWRGRLPVDVVGACEAGRTQILFADTVERTSSERLRA